jgi:hypothetical protein
MIASSQRDVDVRRFHDRLPIARAVHMQMMIDHEDVLSGKLTFSKHPRSSRIAAIRLRRSRLR